MFQKGEHKVFRIATGITPQGDLAQYAQMDAPAEWADDVLCELFSASVSTESNISANLISLPLVEEDKQAAGFAIDLGGKAPPSHDAIYGGWTACPQSTTTSSSSKNVLLASSSSDDEKNKHHTVVGTG